MTKSSRWQTLKPILVGQAEQTPDYTQRWFANRWYLYKVTVWWTFDCLQRELDLPKYGYQLLVNCVRVTQQIDEWSRLSVMACQIHSFIIHSFTRSFVRSFARSFGCWCVHLLVRPLVCSFIHLFILYSFIYWLLNLSLVLSHLSVQYCGEPLWPRGSVLSRRPSGLKFRVLCLEGRVISFI